MTEPIPVNLAAIAARHGRADAKRALANQVNAEERFEADVERGFNSMAASREQARFNRFRSLESRHKPPVQANERVEAVEGKNEQDLADDFTRRNPELPANRLRDLRSNLSEDQTAEEILQQVADAFDDPTLADEAFDYLERATEGGLKQKITQARDLHTQLREREIIAGRNIDSVAKNYAARGYGSSPTELRNLYRDVTGNPRDHNVLFTELSNEYPFEQLKEIVNFLLKGMAYDMKSKGPSIQEPELMRLMTETRNLQSILWVYLFFKERLKMIRAQYKKYQLPYPRTLSFEKLARAFIKIVEDKYPSVMKILRDAEQMGLLDDDEKVIILSQFRDAIRGLSPRVYRSMRHRQDLLLALIEALEELESEEEEEE